MASKFFLLICRKAGRQARDQFLPRARNTYLMDADARAAWFTGWDLRDNELEENAMRIARIAGKS